MKRFSNWNNHRNFHDLASLTKGTCTDFIYRLVTAVHWEMNQSIAHQVDKWWAKIRKFDGILRANWGVYQWTELEPRPRWPVGHSYEHRNWRYNPTSSEFFTYYLQVEKPIQVYFLNMIQSKVQKVQLSKSVISCASPNSSALSPFIRYT